MMLLEIVRHRAIEEIFIVFIVYCAFLIFVKYNEYIIRGDSVLWLQALLIVVFSLAEIRSHLHITRHVYLKFTP